MERKRAQDLPAGPEEPFRLSHKIDTYPRG